ncbi:unnamed protein product [Schistocephalus solidus]|uniref:C2H2-type domain-containing protein n=1 Tax=Schistocephalus solidus TaxID=70667 RepID=A0A183SUA6_SCHSO|nr:unnamed protein product [Schistocephalus solidus]
MPVSTDLALQFLQLWLDTVFIPLLRAYDAKFRELHAQALDISGNYSTVAGQGDAPSDASSQQFPSVYPFPDLGIPSPPPPPPSASHSSDCHSYRTDTYEVVAPEEAISRPAFGADLFEHSLPIPTPRHTESFPSMAVGQTFNIPLPRTRVTAGAQSHNRRTFSIIPFVDVDSTDADIDRLPSLSSEDVAPFDYEQAYTKPPLPRPSHWISCTAIEQTNMEELESLSELNVTRSLRKRRAAGLVNTVNTFYEAIKLESCTSYDTVRAFLHKTTQKNQTVYRSKISVVRIQNDSATLHVKQVSYKPVILTMLTQLRWSGHLVRMDDERLPKRLFYGVVATGSRRQGGQKRRYKDTLKKSLRQLQINSATWEDLAQDRPAWRRSVKTGSAIYEANRIAAAKAKIAARKSPAPRINTANAQALPTCPRCQRIFRAQIGLVGHLRTQCTNNPTIPISTSNSANPHSDSPTLTPDINSITPTIIETTSIYSSPVTTTTTTTTDFTFTTTTTTTTTTTAISDGESLLSCTQCDRTFTSRIGLVGHLRIHRTETGEPVPGA